MTKVDFRGTELMPEACGETKVESRMGSTKIDARFEKLTPATKFRPEYLTYVLWGITPEGRANNLGEVVLEGDHSKLLATSELQAFGLVVTAEPYFAVTQPSDVVVMENFVRDDTAGTIEQVDAKYQLLERGTYTYDPSRSNLHPIEVDAKGPLQLYEARNAVQIARNTGADRYAPDTLQKAQQQLKNAEDYMSGEHRLRKPLETVAREATQIAEDARIITIRKIQEEQWANERAAAADREAKAKAAAAQVEAEQRAEAERRQRALEERVAAERLKREAEEAAQRAARERTKAETARAQAVAQQQAQVEVEKAQLAAQEADRLRQQAENEKIELRQRLLEQLNLILETRDSARGLIVNMSDVLFDTGKHNLRPAAREKLAKIAGIVLAHPGLKLEVEGHTDNVGGDVYDQRLSEARGFRAQLPSPARYFSALASRPRIWKEHASGVE